MIRLPAGVTADPLTDDDVDAVVALVRHCEEHDSGQPLYERADLVSDLALADRARDALVVREAGEVVAWAMVAGARSRWADVHPGWRGRGLGRALVEWSVARAAELGADRIGQSVDDTRADAVALVRACGSHPTRTAWILHRHLDLGGPGPVVREVPGVRVRDSLPEDEPAVLGLLAEAFTQGPDRPATSIEAWQAMVTGREGFQAQDLQVAVLDAAARLPEVGALGAGERRGEGAGAGCPPVSAPPVSAESAGRIVGVAFVLADDEELWVDKLATAADQRGRGIGQLLLERVFAEAHARGVARVALSTDSTSGARAFYERLGMTVARSFTHWAIDLAPGARTGELDA